MKKNFIIILLIITPTFFYAQSGSLNLDNYDIDRKLTSSIIGKSVLIVPFNSDMYNNQESRYIVEASQIHYEQSVNYFKSSLDSALVKALSDSCKVISMLTTFTQSTASDLEKIHSASKYKMIDRPVPIVEPKRKTNLFSDKSRNSSSAQPQKSGIHNGEIVSVREDMSKKFMSVSFDDEEFINSMTIKYGAKYILFITQFDIKGDYSDPYKVAQKSYDRIMNAHYCIFDNTGKFIDGNYIEHRFTAKEDNIYKICLNNFPQLASEIVKKIP
jgi:hypothetical protein